MLGVGGVIVPLADSGIGGTAKVQKFRLRELVAERVNAEP